ncbi:hypothetical protein MRX96_045661 [Rhipicephalus microplus]
MALAKLEIPAVVAALWLMLVSTVSCLGEHKLHRHQVDAFAVADNFPDAVAVYSSSDDPSLECLYANRTEYAPRQKAVYVWSLKGHRGSQKVFIFTMISDYFRPYLVKFQYTNHKKCNIAANFPFHGDVCMLWVTGASRFSVPQECVDHFEDICDAEVPVYNEDICKEEL